MRIILFVLLTIALCSGQSCGTTSLPMPNDVVDTIQPVSGSRGSCSTSSAYYNSQYTFGFTPPAGFDGPYALADDDYVGLIDIGFVDELVLGGIIFVHVVIDPSTSIESLALNWETSLIYYGEIVLNKEWHVMPNGRSFVIFETLIDNDIVTIEAFALSDGLAYELRYVYVPSVQPPSYKLAILNSFRTLCVD